ncbi:protein EDS1L isoform X2 [Eucalyptus grandis]|uniref:protein EDS1L isoform X2 n=1 Tax=Eucalyptus grandis TaxID=71139 RepID=UPI00192EADF8|nr:protein EDS1L isoform X2 [Eucalyptus grandis]
MDGILGINDEVIKAALSASIEARDDRQELNICNRSSEVIVAFPRSWSPEDWFPKDSKAKSFGDDRIDRKKCPSLRSIGLDEDARVNKAFMERFLRILDDESGRLRSEVKKALDDNKQIIFTGHSSGGPIAIYATVWFLEEHRKSKKEETPHAFCLTFGSPLTTDRTFGHAIRRERWSDHFVHFVTKLDIVPRILLAPSSPTRELLKEIASFSDPHHKPASIDNLASFFVNVVKNASCVANYAACQLTGSKHTLFDTMSNFIKPSPYRPCGNYVFCTEIGRSVVVKNPDAVLRLLFCALQIESERELLNIAQKSLRAHWTYEEAINQSLASANVVYLKNLRELPLSSNDAALNDLNLNLRELPLNSDDAALNDLNLDATARLCLRAAGELEKRKQDNQKKIQGKKVEIERYLDALKKYRTTSEDEGVGYYDAFKLQKKEEDFKANVKRLELAAIWDEIVEMLRLRQLPDEFEVDKEWVDLGTRFRGLVEPLDIANFYRHSRTDDAGHYMKEGNRPSRYKFPQRWREHKYQLPPMQQSQQSLKHFYGESSFLAKVEELRTKPWEAIKDEVPVLGNRLTEWYKNKEVEGDLFLQESTLVKWWQDLCKDHPDAELHNVLPIPPVK